MSNKARASHTHTDTKLLSVCLLAPISRVLVVFLLVRRDIFDVAAYYMCVCSPPPSFFFHISSLRLHNNVYFTWTHAHIYTINIFPFVERSAHRSTSLPAMQLSK